MRETGSSTQREAGKPEGNPTFAVSILLYVSKTPPAGPSSHP